MVMEVGLKCQMQKKYEGNPSQELRVKMLETGIKTENKTWHVYNVVRVLFFS